MSGIFYLQSSHPFFFFGLNFNHTSHDNAKAHKARVLSVLKSIE
jgi:hypothetical protein